MDAGRRSDISKADAGALANLIGEGLRSDAGRERGDLPPPQPDIDISGYRVAREIGRGGMGRVFEAVQLSTRRKVALKVMLEGAFVAEKARRRFEREVRIAATLRHPNIAQIYESGLDAGHCWFAMELCDGKPLDEAVEVANLSLRQRIELMARVCEAVGHAHARSIVHRDLKPSNILVSEDGSPHVLDFGLAKIEDPQWSRGLTLSAPGELMGTPAYMSPEQTRRDPDSVDARSDVYSLGVVLYRLLTGRFPYRVDGRIDEVVHEIASVEPTSPRRFNPGIDREMQAIVLKALAKEPEHRYQTAAEMGCDLRCWLAGEPVAARLPSGSYRLRKALARHRRRLIAVLVLIVAVGISALATWVWLNPRPAPGGTFGPSIRRIRFQIQDLRVPEDSAGAHAAAICDLDGDGHKDILCGAAGGDADLNSYVYWNAGSRNFIECTSIGAAAAPAGLVVISPAQYGGTTLDADPMNRPDVLLLHHLEPKPSLLLANFDGRTAQTSWEVALAASDELGGNNCSGLAVGDLDGDGDLDAVSGHRGGYLYLSWNDGTGHFKRTRFDDLGVHNDVALADFDGDGDLDILDAGPVGGWTGYAAVFWNGGAGTFQNRSFFPGRKQEQWGVSVADLEGDGDCDIALAVKDLGVARVFRNEGKRVFTDVRGSFRSGYDVDLCDLNGDGLMELVQDEDREHAVLIFWNTSEGFLAEPDRYVLPTGAARDVGGSLWPRKPDGTRRTPGLRLCVADMDGDGYNDIFVGTCGSQSGNYILWATP